MGRSMNSIPDGPWAYGPRRRRGLLRTRWSVVAAATAFFLVASSSIAFATVRTDQEDYAPGSVVTISGDNSNGAGYLPGETVVVNVSGPNGYEASCEAVADENGAWSCQVTLWDSDLAVGEYTYTATGQTSGASESGAFTDGSVRVFPAPTNVTFTLTKTVYTSDDCTGAGTSQTVPGVKSPSGDTTGLPSGSIKLQAAGTSDQGTAFIKWTSADPFTDLGGGAICVKGSKGSGNLDYTANYEAPSTNTAPSIAFTTTHTQANEGDTKTFVFSITDASSDTHSYVNGYPDCGSGNVLESSSIDNATHTGTFQCTFVDGVVPAVQSTVKVKVKDQGGLESGELTQSVTVYNVAPSVAQPAFKSTTIDCRNEVTLTGISFSDLGVNDYPWNVNIDWGDGSTDTNYNTNSQGSQSNQTHTYNAPGTYTATVTVEDKDGGEGSNTSSNAVVVNQVYAVDFLPPFDDSSPSGLIINKMKSGRVVPVKATIYDVCAQDYVTDPTTQVTIKVSKTSGTGTGDPVEEYADAGQSSAGTNLFRWTTDSTVLGGGFWIYNLDSKALGLVVNNLYRIDINVGANLATRDTWAVLAPVK